MNEYTDVLKRVPAQSNGSVVIEHSTPSQFDRLMGAIHRMPLNRERYCRLLINGEVVMTDAEFERKTNLSAIYAAHGNALIAGLGIGLILEPFIKKCSSVTVIEKNADVISSVGQHYPEISIIHADIFQWEPPKVQKWDTIYFDVWSFFNDDTDKQALSLIRKYRKHLKPKGWIGAWTIEASNAADERKY